MKWDGYSDGVIPNALILHPHIRERDRFFFLPAIFFGVYSLRHLVRTQTNETHPQLVRDHLYAPQFFFAALILRLIASFFVRVSQEWILKYIFIVKLSEKKDVFSKIRS
jgi:hypothetical protein